ncbi:MAG: aminoacyl-tRNA hydrolase [Candidatus Pacebacteria bacterium]|nr:aminoacyl-tRNA hydrolase [Candidatus Paceibacterota bacterium]
MKLIVGLGNPGRKYERSRHNLGFMVLDRLARQKRVSFRIKKKFSCSVSFLPDQEAILVKPAVFMNESGLAVKKLAEFYRVKAEDFYLLHDDVDLPLGRIRIVRSRGSAGHKGVLSVIDHLKTIDFVRFRLGIGRYRAGSVKGGGKTAIKYDSHDEMTAFVLSDFLITEQDELRRLIKTAAGAVQLALEGGVESAMNQFN